MTRPASDPSRGPLHKTGKRIVVSRPVHAKLWAIKTAREAALEREVTFSEIIDEKLGEVEQ